jgi:hypothetical protein
MVFLKRAALEGQTFEATSANINRATRLMGMFVEQLDAMAKLQGSPSSTWSSSTSPSPLVDTRSLETSYLIRRGVPTAVSNETGQCRHPMASRGTASLGAMRSNDQTAVTVPCSRHEKWPLSNARWLEHGSQNSSGSSAEPAGQLEAWQILTRGADSAEATAFPGT